MIHFQSIFVFAECRSISTEEEDQIFDLREEPDGAETSIANGTIRSSTSQNRPLSQIFDASAKSSAIKVPEWVASEASLDVQFNERADNQIVELEVDRVSRKKSNENNQK